MESVLRLLVLSVAMLIGSYIAGWIPLAMSLSEDKLKLVSVLGAGLLIGTALAVIIPEGVHTLYISQSEHEHSHHHEKKLTEKLSSIGKNLLDARNLGKDHVEAHSQTEEHHGMEMHSLIGIALILGFLFMLLIDQLGGGHRHTSTRDPENTNNASNNKNRITATLGLVVHAAADGIALGAAASTSQTHVEMIVFIAIMLHKAPAAFGLVSFLLHEGLERSKIRKHLAVFSGAAPLLAIITFIGLSRQSKETLTDINATGLAMLFSAGTFLYVSTVHVLPEIQKMETKVVGADGNTIIREQHGFSKLELAAFISGAIFPVILSIGHHH